MATGIQNIFAQVPKTYEFINHILTFGFDIIWRKKAVRQAVDAGGNLWIDVCSGTGETAMYLARFAQNGTKVFASDFSLPMLKEAKSKKEGRKIRCNIADVKVLPFPDNTFDLVTISFATRNINTSHEALLKSFSEFHRILKPGGRFINLETSQPGNRLFRAVFHWYIKTFVKPIGWRISGSKAAYIYLSQTIPKWYPANELKKILEETGYSSVSYKRLLFGTAAIHQSIK
jgi:demethylmenaquinone methyltransferase/2-methoxy-6-polyprenyl-1,4-benzoquinol methylase